MAEQNRHDVVNLSQSGGDISPSDGPASKPDNYAAEGDGEGFKNIANQDPIQRQMSAETREDTSNEVDIRAVHKDGGGVITEHTTSESVRAETTLNSTLAETMKMNGVASNIDNSEDRSVSPNVGEASGGSDTDISRTESRAADGNQHSRTSSVKRPASFKPVSFAKFSVSKSPGPAPAARITGDKATLSTTPSSTPLQQPSRPRLVAKSAGGLREQAPRAPGANKSGSSAPDPSQVWNKNRPTQPASTKHLTDEELKQQYGIHMTSRIQTDGDRKEANWADIDDDEDDWAPETIEWNDGTKITLTQTDNLPTSGQTSTDTKETTPTSVTLDHQSAGLETSKPVAPRTPSTLGPNARVLRVGGHAERQHLKPGNDTSKGPNEKATLVSKSTAKSPWASLPPVEKVPPVAINPASEGPRASRTFQAEGSVSEPPAAGPPPTKEIAADDFNRSWRDGQSSTPRELFNSQSGRYEPVGGRRGQPKNEGFRPSSLLQRPPHHDQSGPAEPSAAFQTYRTSATQEGGQWSRRRASSTISGGSGNGIGRRMSVNKQDTTFAEFPPHRRDVQQNRTSERSVSPHHHGQQHPPNVPGGAQSDNQSTVSPNPPYRVGANHHFSPPGQPAVSTKQSISSGADEPSGPVASEDPVAVQQQIMRERLELARQRRKEEEEREEAAKQERIRLKLEAMGPAPVKQPQTAAESPKQPASSASVQSPPKPPVPEPTGEPKQYGMMKVHHPESVKKLVGAGDRMQEKSFGPQGRQLPSPRETKAEPKTSEHVVNGVRPSKDQPEAQTPGPSSEPQADDKRSQWKAPVPTPGAFPSWAGTKLSAHTAPVASLWGPPYPDRALGNGTFDRNLTSFPPQDIPSSGPLALSDQLAVSSAPTYGDRIGAPERMQSSLHSGPRTMGDNGQPASPLHSPEKRPAVPQSPKSTAGPGPIAPPATAHGQRRHPDQLPRHSQQTAAWHNFHNMAARAEADENDRFHRELTARREEEAKSGIAPSLQVSFNEKWRQVDPGSQAGQRHIIGVTTSTSDKEKETPLTSLHGLGSPVTGLPVPQDYPKPSATMPARGSRFFPQGTEQPRPSQTHDTLSTRSASPPPPEEASSHPVFKGDSHRPLVHLPTPKPRVRLPPGDSPTSPPPSFSSVATASPPSLRAHSRPIVSTSVWQDRFNGLFGKRPSQSKTQALAVTSATKEPLDVQPCSSPAAVSFPRETFRDSGKVTSKEVEEEEAIFEDREAGSLPVVNVPNMAPPAAWPSAYRTEPPSAHKFRSKNIQSLSIEPYMLGQLTKDHTGAVVIAIRLPGRDATKTLPWPTKKAGGSAPRQRANPSNKHRKGARSRDGTVAYHNPQAAKKSTPVNMPSGSSRTPAHNGNWASRVAGTNI